MTIFEMISIFAILVLVLLPGRKDRSWWVGAVNFCIAALLVTEILIAFDQGGDYWIAKSLLVFTLGIFLHYFSVMMFGIGHSIYKLDFSSISSTQKMDSQIRSQSIRKYIRILRVLLAVSFIAAALSAYIELQQKMQYEIRATCLSECPDKWLWAK